MTTMELNAEISHQLSLIADDESTLQRVLKYVKRITAHKEKAIEEEYISKEELLAGIREGLLDLKEAQRTGKKLMTAEELLNEL
ncbi:MAG: hypothetical protein LBL97_01175 [Prevotellaceae bacterium]|jgi:methionyl-tRNA formyltransferase|nr:hypothetical protein [Prevotellaceae bacterium]